MSPSDVVAVDVSASKHASGSTAIGSIATTAHALYCFDALAAYFESRQPVTPPFESDESYALFVTWNTAASRRSNGKPVLRGCIGSFKPLPLAKGLAEYALVSALQDERFSPITQSELPSLSVAISLLTPFTPIDDPLAWTPGTHGIHITFPDPSQPSRTLSATYLPEICTDQGWTKEECVLSAIQKAGYRGRVKVGDSVWTSLSVKVYESSKTGIGYQDYVEWKTTQAK